MKKAQVKFGEAFGIIIIVYVVLTVGLSWYNSSNEKNLREMSAENNENLAFEKYNFITNLNLLRNSEDENINYFMDLDAIRAFQNYTNTTEGKNFLRGKLASSRVRIQLYNYTGIQDFIAYENITIYENIPDFEYVPINYRTIIPVYDAIDKRMDVGYLFIEVYAPKH